MEGDGRKEGWEREGGAHKFLMYVSENVVSELLEKIGRGGGASWRGNERQRSVKVGVVMRYRSDLCAVRVSRRVRLLDNKSFGGCRRTMHALDRFFLCVRGLAFCKGVIIRPFRHTHG